MRFVISAAHKSSGKTTVSLGLCRTLQKKGFKIQPFKKGPDYIDPLWLSVAAKRTCRNLDYYTMSAQEIHCVFTRNTQDADISLIEGNKGLHDGLDLEGSNSTAALAIMLKAPVILVVDCEGMTRGVAPLVSGYQNFPPQANIAGLILNKVAGQRHEAKLRASIERYCGIPVLGAIPRTPMMQIAERHLGLIPANEASSAEEAISRIAGIIAEKLDLELLLNIARRRGELECREFMPGTLSKTVKIGVAQDSAFGFYYPEDLELMAQSGAEIIPFNTMKDKNLPENLDGIFIGGGFPETHMETLHANHSLRTEIRKRLENGMPAYAECGGLMYLSRSISWEGITHEMVGFIPGDTVMHKRSIGRGYVHLQETGLNPWGLKDNNGQLIAHEFHHSSLDNLPPDLSFAYKVERGVGITGKDDGIILNNLVASYAHLRSVATNPWASRFVEFVKSRRLKG